MAIPTVRPVSSPDKVTFLADVQLLGTHKVLQLSSVLTAAALNQAINQLFGLSDESTFVLCDDGAVFQTRLSAEDTIRRLCGVGLVYTKWDRVSCVAVLRKLKGGRERR